jgi:hypothetical protein
MDRAKYCSNKGFTKNSHLKYEVCQIKKLMPGMHDEEKKALEKLLWSLGSTSALEN